MGEFVHSARPLDADSPQAVWLAAAGIIDDKLLVSTGPTNLLGPIRLTSALVEHLKSRRGVILYNTSVLAFVPLAFTAIYSATKAALHSYVSSQRFSLRDSGVQVLEVAPPRGAYATDEQRGSRAGNAAGPIHRRNVIRARNRRRTRSSLGLQSPFAPIPALRSMLS